ncbi:MAG: C45 family autoproteolytic acyltransferase/hydrolase [Actinomycetes bacterium]
MTVTTEIVAGGSDDFMTVPHVVVSGSQAEIGRALAEQARWAYGWTPVAAADPVQARARLDWFARHWPQHLDRMCGAAEELGVDLDAGTVHLDGLGGVPKGSACSASYRAPAGTVDGHGVFGRNYDFFTTSQSGLFAMMSGAPAPEETEPPLASHPHVITSLPDDGPATTVLTMNELDGCMEGVNEHGLAVALLIADAETVGVPVDAGPQVGLASVQLPRFLLDTCATAADALDALFGAKQYDLGTPLHYLVADRSGDAFVWERGPGGDEHAVRIDGTALCVTNHLLHRHPDPAHLPADNDETMLSYQRFRTLAERATGPMSADGMRATLDAVRFDANSSSAHPIRTLWRTVFDVERATMATQFYLGDTADGSPRYSPEHEFALPALHR